MAQIIERDFEAVVVGSLHPRWKEIVVEPQPSSGFQTLVKCEQDVPLGETVTVRQRTCGYAVPTWSFIARTALELG